MFLYTIVFFGTTQCHQESRHTQRDDERRFVVRESLPRPPGAQERHPCTHVRRAAWCAQKPVKCFLRKKLSSPNFVPRQEELCPDRVAPSARDSCRRAQSSVRFERPP